jgi:hypothetical protein
MLQVDGDVAAAAEQEIAVRCGGRRSANIIAANGPGPMPASSMIR